MLFVKQKIGKRFNIEKAKLPSRAQEGDILDIAGEVIRGNAATTEERKKKIKGLMDELWE